MHCFCKAVRNWIPASAGMTMGMTMGLFLILVIPLQAIPHTVTGKVIRVMDGDTIEILQPPATPVRIRLAHIDTPERKQPFYQKAKNFTTEKAAGKTVRVDIDTQDRYGRQIGVVWVNSENLNLALVRNGWAWWYTHFSKDTAYQAAEAEAKTRKIGLWSDPHPVPPWQFRQRARSTAKPQ